MRILATCHSQHVLANSDLSRFVPVCPQETSSPLRRECHTLARAFQTFFFVIPAQVRCPVARHIPFLHMLECRQWLTKVIPGTDESRAIVRASQRIFRKDLRYLRSDRHSQEGFAYVSY